MKSRYGLASDPAAHEFPPRNTFLKPADHPEQLTARQRETLILLAKGLHNKEMACEMGISVRTVENHRAKLHEILGIRSLAELVRYAVREKLIAA
jgi:DNA-binding NarL/FixJ family response regulator